MKFGFKLPTIGHLPLKESIGRMAVAGEKAGFDSVWVGDHITVPKEHTLDESHKVGGPRMAVVQLADPFISLAYVAALTSRIELGTSVMVVPLRNPVVTAKAIATLDVYSEGRVLIGTGVGWLEEEFQAVNAPDFAKRGAVTDEWIRIFRACWYDPEPAFEGEHYRFKALNFSPRPVRPVPILIGGNSLPALRRAGRLGDGWHGTRAALHEIPKCIQIIKQEAEKAGRDPAKLSYGHGIEFDITKPGAARRTEGFYSPEKAVVGTPAEVCDKIAAIRDAGIQHLELRFRVQRDLATPSLTPVLEMIDQVASDILPKFRT